jgi:MFS family permease
LYLVGASFGGGLAAWLPGLVASYGLRFEHLPAWRMCFILSGLAGPIVAGLLLTTMEPRRQGGRVGSDVFSGLKGAGRLLNGNRLVFAGIYIGFALFLLTTIAVAGWGPAFLMRSFHLSPSNIGSGLGVGLTIAGVAGYFLAGLAVDLPRLQHPSGRLSVLTFACIVALPVTLCASATTPTIGILLLCSVTFAAPMVYVAASALLQDLVPNDMRGFAVALNSMLGTVVAFSGGPLLVSLLTDHVFHDETKVGVAIGIVTAPALLLSATAYGLALHGLKRRSPLAGIEAHAILATESTI